MYLGHYGSFVTGLDQERADETDRSLIYWQKVLTRSDRSGGWRDLPVLLREITKVPAALLPT